MLSPIPTNAMDRRQHSVPLIMTRAGQAVQRQSINNWIDLHMFCQIQVTKQGTKIAKWYNKRHLADRKLQNNKPPSLTGNALRMQCTRGTGLGKICVIQATG